MKGVIFETAGAVPKVVDNLPVPEPSTDQMLVKSLYTAMNPVYVTISLSILYVALSAEVYFAYGLVPVDQSCLSRL